MLMIFQKKKIYSFIKMHGDTNMKKRKFVIKVIIIIIIICWIG
jgi:hypothetical protein